MKKRFLEPGVTCWRLERASRVAPLIDAADYFAALRKALVSAERNVFIIGWDVDSRTPVVGPDGDTHDDLPVELGDLLSALVSRRPSLTVHVLLWDYSVVYTLDREPLPVLNLDWATPDAVKVCLDDVLPLGASHHQKIVTVDDALAFCGGIDLTIRRWDTRAHRLVEPFRTDPDEHSYAPCHDVQVVVDGAAAATVAELARERWHDASCERPPSVEPVGDPWPVDLPPLLKQVDVGIVRTVPAFADRAAIREVEALYLRCIAEAERTLYIENQYLTVSYIAEAIAARLQERPELEVVIVTPTEPEGGWIEKNSMIQGRARFRAILEARGATERVRLLAPYVQGDSRSEAVNMHAKTLVVDDRLLRIGSSNLNNRSMGTDTECDLAVEAADDNQRAAIARYSDDLLAEHLGVAVDEVRSARESGIGLLAMLDTLAVTERGLKPIQDPIPETALDAVVGIADLEKPAPIAMGNLFNARGYPAPPGRSRTLIIVTVVGIFIIAWALSPLAQLISEATNAASLEVWFDRVARSAWSPLLVSLLYILAGLFLFPVTLLVAITAMVFSPWQALVYALAGSVLSAWVSYHLGAMIGHRYLRGIMGRRLNRISRAMAAKGVLGVVAIRAVPVAPFTIINLAAGASHIRLPDFLLGTIIGMIPGIATLTFLGRQVFNVYTHPSMEHVPLLVVAASLWVLVTLGFQRVVTRLRRSRADT